MAEDLADLGHGRTTAEHSGRQRVSQEMGSLAVWLQPGSPQGVADDNTDGAVTGKAAMRCPVADKNTPRRTGRSHYLRSEHRRIETPRTTIAAETRESPRC